MTTFTRSRRLLLLTAVGVAAATVLTTLVAVNSVPKPMRVVEPIRLNHAIGSEAFAHLQRVVLDVPAVSGNHVEVLNNGEEIFPAMLAAIDSAEHSVTFEVYEFWGEEIGGAFSQAFADAARRGVRVHVILDYIGSVPAGREKIQQMEDAGVELVRWRSPDWYQLSRFNHRTHRKLLIVDGRIGFAGGANVADPWQGSPETGGYRDIHYRFEGPVVAHLQRAFLENWLNAERKLLYGEAYFPLLEESGELVIKTINSSPREGSHQVRLMLLLAISGARERLRLATPYFYPDDMLLDALLDARSRDVEIDLLLPSPEHYSTLIREASKNRWQPLLDAGIRIHEYRLSKYHAKLYIADDYWVSVGSTNLDNRSFRLNDETNVIIMDQDFARKLADRFERDLDDATPITFEDLESRPRWRRAVGALTMAVGWHL